MKLKAILISALAIGCALFHSCSKHVEQSYYSEHPAATAALDSLFSSVFPAGGPGAIVGMTVNGDMVYRHGFGQANLATEALYTDSTTTNICAATRAFTTAAIMKLVQDGKLSLEQPISDFSLNSGRRYSRASPYATYCRTPPDCPTHAHATTRNGTPTYAITNQHSVSPTTICSTAAKVK